MAYRIRVLPQNRILTAPEGGNLLVCLREAGLAPDAPCGGSGSCGKCRVCVGGEEVLACCPDPLTVANSVVTGTEFLELASLPEFQRCFAKNMRF